MHEGHQTGKTWAIVVVVKTFFDILSCSNYQFKMNKDEKMWISPLQSKLKLDVVLSKFEHDWCRGSQDIAKNVKG